MRLVTCAIARPSRSLTSCKRPLAMGAASTADHGWKKTRVPSRRAPPLAPLCSSGCFRDPARRGGRRGAVSTRPTRGGTGAAAGAAARSATAAAVRAAAAAKGRDTAGSSSGAGPQAAHVPRPRSRARSSAQCALERDDGRSPARSRLITSAHDRVRRSRLQRPRHLDPRAARGTSSILTLARAPGLSYGYRVLL